MAAKRRIVMFNRVTADGYFSAPDGNLDWAVPDEELDKAGAGATSGAGTILFGRRTYDMFESFWPTAVDDSPTARDPHAPRHSPEIRAMGVWINQATKLVFSRTRKDVTWTNSRLLREIDPREIEALKGQDGKDMMIFGSGSVVTQLTRHRLIDEYRLIVNPVFLGSGKLLFKDLEQKTPLELVELTKYPSGNVMLRYALGK
jgi:dihydrofolate reductase